MLFENFIVYYLAPIVHGLGSRAFIPQNRVRVPVGVLVALGMTGMVRLHFRLNATAGRVTYLCASSSVGRAADFFHVKT